MSKATLWMYLLIAGALVVGIVVLVTAAATFQTGKYHLMFINLALFVWAMICICWAKALIKKESGR